MEGHAERVTIMHLRQVNGRNRAVSASDDVGSKERTRRRFFYPREHSHHELPSSLSGSGSRTYFLPPKAY